MKVTVVGAGNVGATCAKVLATREVANEVVLLDIKDGFAEGKALDIWETSPINLYDTRTVGSTNDYSKTANSDVVVITSGLPRKPGMSRDDLIATNAGIVKTVTTQIMEHSPNAILVIVSNPLDVMTYCAYLNAGVDSKRVLGMAGILDTARYRSFLAEALNVSPKDIQAVLMGGHGDTMVPLPRYTTVGGIPVTELIDDETLQPYVDYDGNPATVSYNAEGVSVGDAPQTQVGIAMRYKKKGLYIKPRYTFFDRFYADFDPFSLNGDNEGRQSWKMPAYGLLDLHMGYTLDLESSQMDFRFSVFNLLNKVYL